MTRIVLSVACAILLVCSVQGCGFFNIKCKVQDAIEQAGSQLIGEAKVAFEQAMDHVFDQDILPLLDKVEAAINAGIDKVDKDVNETIIHIQNSMEVIIQDAAQTANALANNITHDIEQIIANAASAILQVEKEFYTDASHLLTQINQIVQKGQCMEAGGAKQIQDQIYKLLRALNPYYRLSSCWHSLGYKPTMTLEDLTDIQLYNYQKVCTLLNKITPTTPVKGPGGILETYAQGQLYAAEYYCIGETANAPAFEDVMTKEWLWWGVQYDAWRDIGKRGMMVQQPKDDPSCGTPVECYAEAVKALQEAEQKILGLQIGLSNLNQTVKANNEQQQAYQKQVNSSLSELASSVSANNQAIKNTNTTNNNNIVSISNRLSGLTTYPCNCTRNATHGSVCLSGMSQGYYCSRPPPAITTGIVCCEVCLGTAKDAATYTHEHPVLAAVDSTCKSTLVPLGLKVSGVPKDVL